MCPLGKMRMTTPCRAVTCSHLQCFDASLYLQMNERKPTWNCPVCDKPSLYDNLVIDGYFQEMAHGVVIPKKTVKLEKPTTVNVDDSIEIIGDDVEIIVNNTASSSTDKPKDEEKPTEKKKDVVDLTLSDSDDDEPLAKRKALNPKPEGEILWYWQGLPGMDHSKAFMKYPKEPRSGMLLGLNRQKLKTLLGLYRGYCRLKYHMHRIGLVEGNECRLCLEDPRMADHILCICSALEGIRFSVFGRIQLIPEDLDGISPNKVISFIKRLNVLDSTSISSSSNQSRVTTTPGPSSVSSSGYPASPSVINLDSPSPPRSPPAISQPVLQAQPASCLMSGQTNGNPKQPTTYLNPNNNMPYLDLDNEAAASATINYPPNPY
ncbi:hypothetical protein NQ317_009329 [Molorchus minor]|uniref:SP-RING-type domain-containing protein n=1 Tax=Molorchus minor TaxID=1323400 RepID=A0ABQ9JGH1_9CUCU|nr:hypothetical protein NQ317_009329 [Molorchus minor]